MKKKTFEQESGSGIEISHRDGVYPVKELYFINEDLTKEWMEELKCYKGESVEGLYDFKKKIGTGKFSVVYNAIEKSTNQKVAIKVIETFKLDQEARELIAHESSIMSVLSSPFLVQYKTTVQTKIKIFIITELIEGKDLFEFVKENKCLCEREAAMIAYQIIRGVKDLHALGIVHRDLKPENIMISLEGDAPAGMVKIIDFGFANYLTSLKSPQDLLAGTPNYISPEMLRSEPIDEKIDNFAIGVIIYFALSGSLPFNGHNIPEIFQKTLDGSYGYTDKAWTTVSVEAKNLIDGLLENDPAKRISLDEAMKHPWLKSAHKKNEQLQNPVQKRPTKKSIEVF